MNLFQYNPQVYKGTQVDLPIDFIYQQLETKQKEFDLQNAAVDKAAENFLKINPGMLTKEAYERVKQQYLPQLEKIRDTLINTGNVAMAAPELSRFTTNLAADSEVKNIMEDYKLTEAYTKNLQEGKYTDKIFAGLRGPDGTPRPQLEKGQMTSAAYYSPMQYTDPVSSLLPEAEKFKANVIEDIKSNPNKYGVIQTDETTVEALANEQVRQWANQRLSSWKQNPENQAYFWNATGYKPETFTPEMWDQNVAKNIADLLAYTKVTKARSFHNMPDISMQAPKPTKPEATPAEEAAKKTGAPVNRRIITGKEGGLASFEQNRYNGNFITNLNDFNTDLEYTKTSMQENYQALVTLSNGAIPSGLDLASGKNGSRTDVRNWINTNYTKNQYGEWVAKSATAPPVTPEITATLTGFTEANYAHNAKQKLFNSLSEQTGVKNYNPQVTQDAVYRALHTDDANIDVPQEVIDYNRAADRAIDELLLNKGYNPRSDIYLEERKKLQSLSIAELSTKLQNSTGQSVDYYLKAFGKNSNNPKNNIVNKYLTEATGILLQGSNEGKIHKAFENFKNKMSEYQLSDLPGDGKFPEYERQLINMGIAGQLSGLTDIINNVKADEGDGLEEFVESIPYKDGDPNKGVDTESISVSMGYTPKKGVVGVLSFSGKFYEFDLDKANIDQQFTYEHPELTQELRIYRDISNSVRRSSNTEGKFNVGNLPFEFKVQTKNIGTDKPEFYYEFSADGVNLQKYTNVGEIIAQASDIASKKLDQQQIIIQGAQAEILEKANRRIAALPINTPPEVVAQIKQQAAIDMEEIPKKVAQVFNANNKPIGSVGKQTPQTKDPLNLGL
jgi:hypothetical protein